MKKRIFFIAILIFAVCALLTACNNAKAKEGVTVTFDTGCDIVIDPIVIDGAEEKYMPEDPVRAGYEFAGWYYDQSHLLRFSTADAITMDITLYAKWIKKVNGNENPGIIIEETYGIKFVLSDDKYTVAGYTGQADTLVVPAKYGGYPVSAIAAGAFAGSSLKEISLGNGITDIKEFAFRGATKLEYIRISSDNIYYCDRDGILYNADGSVLFWVPDKTKASKLTLKSVTKIKPYAFENCKLDVEFSGDAYPELEGKSFAGFAGKITLGQGIKSIGKDAFNGATCEVTFESDSAISVLQNGAFDSYKGNTLTVPSSVKEIKWQAFNNCTATVDLSKAGLTEIGEKAFAGYLGKELVIPYSVTKIGKDAFYCAKTAITFQSGSLYTEVEALAFNRFGDNSSQTDNKVVASVHFPAGVKKIGENAFSGASAEIYFDCPQSSLEISATAFNATKANVHFKD